MNITLDNREGALYENILNCIKKEEKFKDIKVSLSQLIIGDVLIGDSIVIERKTVSDLISSIKDKRYQEQSFRLDEYNIHNHNIIYLIEGNRIPEVSKQMFYSALFSLSYYKGFSLHRSNNLEESAYIICNMSLKMINEKEKTPYYSRSIENNKENVYSSNLLPKKKSSYVTQDNIDEIMLCQIPSISEIVAKGILKHFGSLFILMSKLKTEEGIEELKKIKVGVSNRNIGKNCVEALLKYLVK